MTVGAKIKKIRIFRNMSQKDLASHLDLGPKGDNRLAQYETNYRVPKEDLLKQIATALDVNPLTLRDVSGENAEEIMEILFWMEEANPGAIRLFRMEKADFDSEEPVAYYPDSDRWPAHAPVGMYFGSGILDGFMKEWQFRKEELATGTISKEEYFEWKIGWPYTCDECGKYEPKKRWRKE